MRSLTFQIILVLIHLYYMRKNVYFVCVIRQLTLIIGISLSLLQKQRSYKKDRDSRGSLAIIWLGQTFISSYYYYTLLGPKVSCYTVYSEVKVY